MAEVCIDIPDELKEEIEESKLDVSTIVREIIISKLFERQLIKSKALQRAMFETLVAKSKLTEEGAKELSNIINKGMFKELQEKFPDL